MTHTPTQEQQKSIYLFKQGADVIINAFAGTGKTSTLVMLANNSLRASKGLYVAFNNSTVKEAKSKFPRNITCSTINALAVKYLDGFDLQTKVFKPKVLTKAHIKGFFQNFEKYFYYSFQKSEDTYEDVYLYEDELFELIFRTIFNYFTSDVPTLVPSHVPILGAMQDFNNQEVTCFLKIYIAKMARKYVSEAFNSQSSTPLGFQGSVKLWALNNPTLPYDFVLLDEAQDTDPVFAGILKKQKCQKVIVGDKYQQIYSWRGAINAMDKFDIKNTIYLTQSFRFGSVIADLASSVLLLLQEKQRVNGCGPQSIIPNNKLPDAYLCKTNAGVIEVVLDLMHKGLTPVVPSNIQVTFKIINELEKIINGKKSSDPMFMGIKNFQQVQACAQADPYSELNIYLRLINKFPINSIVTALSLLQRSPRNGPIGPIVTTIHKAKGDEWDFVYVHDDFPSPRQDNGIFHLSSDTLNLIYVAITRAKKGLTLPIGIKNYLNIVKQKRKFQLEIPQKKVTCEGSCLQCSLVNMEISYSFQKMNEV